MLCLLTGAGSTRSFSIQRHSKNDAVLLRLGGWSRC